MNLPENAPEEYKDRATLWNSVEAIEKQHNSQLCRTFKASQPLMNCRAFWMNMEQLITALLPTLITATTKLRCLERRYQRGNLEEVPLFASSILQSSNSDRLQRCTTVDKGETSMWLSSTLSKSSISSR
ncbi:MobA/MobL family protein [Pseudobutyrivibrio sp. JW11]|uniref:MobA/MobL family protein n=1 Tax=Pseudobutyrivibrio sp. JW11 TaxID=1855302 RepID=UPI001160776C